MKKIIFFLLLISSSALAQRTYMVVPVGNNFVKHNEGYLPCYELVQDSLNYRIILVEKVISLGSSVIAYGFVKQIRSSKQWITVASEVQKITAETYQDAAGEYVEEPYNTVTDSTKWQLQNGVKIYGTKQVLKPGMIQAIPEYIKAEIGPAKEIRIIKRAYKLP
jgi:hypothetical protein